MKNIFGIIIMGLAFLGCQKKEVSAKLGKSIQLNFEEKAYIKSENLNIKFIDVGDSRCPTGAECFWSGEGLVTLNVNETIISISTLEPLDSLGYTFVITDLSPYPKLNDNLKPKDYKVDFIVSK